jgi:hypothetical protein
VPLSITKVIHYKSHIFERNGSSVPQKRVQQVINMQENCTIVPEYRASETENDKEIIFSEFAASNQTQCINNYSLMVCNVQIAQEPTQDGKLTY